MRSRDVRSEAPEWFIRQLHERAKACGGHQQHTERDPAGYAVTNYRHGKMTQCTHKSAQDCMWEEPVQTHQISYIKMPVLYGWQEKLQKANEKKLRTFGEPFPLKKIFDVHTLITGNLL